MTHTIFPQNNPLIESHPFAPFIPNGAELLILGSFPCFNGINYGEWYYSGSGKNMFWSLISETFNHSVESYNDKVALCTKYKIALSDIAYKIKRKYNNCSDSNLIILEKNYKSIHQCLVPSLKKIFCTSRFVYRHFVSMFPHVQCPVHILTSPSPAANRYIAGLEEYKTLKQVGDIHSLYEYRLLKYKTLLL